MNHPQRWALSAVLAGLALSVPLSAHAQSVPLYQSGTMAPNHIAKFATNGLVQDAGGLLGDSLLGKGLSPFAVTDPHLGLCFNTAVTSGAYHSLCLGHDKTNASAIYSVDGQEFPFVPNGSIVAGSKPYSDVTLFGAACDGVTDDTAAIATLDALPNTVAIGVYATCRLSGNLTLAHPVYIGRAGALSVDAGRTLTLAGATIEAAAPFPGLGTVAVGAPVTNLKNVKSIDVGIEQFADAFGTTLLKVGTAGGINGVVGQTSNTLPANTFAFPTGTTGACRLMSGGNHCFGLYGLAEAHQSGGGVAVAAEVTARNMTANNPDTNLPPNVGIGTPNTVPKGLNVTCGAGHGETKDCSIGIHIANETGLVSDPLFNTGSYIHLYRQYGLFIDAMPSGNQTGAVIKANGNGIGLQVQSTAEPTPGASILTALNHLGANLFSVTYAGDALIGGRAIVNSATMITSTTTFTDGAAGFTATLTNAPRAGNPLKWVLINDNGTTRYIPTW